jgi:Polyketide cyclase / dehydrase and lipid transport
MVIEKEIIVNKNIKDAWKVLGIDFANASKWASAVNHSEGSGDKFNGSTCSERGCSTTMGSIKEKLYEFSNENYSLAYEVAEGMPSMVKYSTNTWRLFDLGNEKCKLQIKMDIRMGGFFGSFLQPIMKLQMSKMGNHLVEDFAYYVENGKPHPRKLKALNK